MKQKHEQKHVVHLKKLLLTIHRKQEYRACKTYSGVLPSVTPTQLRRAVRLVWSARGLPVGDGSRKRVMRTLSSKRLVVSKHSPERRKEVIAAPDLVCSKDKAQRRAAMQYGKHVSSVAEARKQASGGGTQNSRSMWAGCCDIRIHVLAGIIVRFYIEKREERFGSGTWSNQNPPQ